MTKLRLSIELRDTVDGGGWTKNHTVLETVAGQEAGTYKQCIYSQCSFINCPMQIGSFVVIYRAMYLKAWKLRQWILCPAPWENFRPEKQKCFNEQEANRPLRSPEYHCPYPDLSRSLIHAFNFASFWSKKKLKNSYIHPLLPYLIQQGQRYWKGARLTG